MSKNIFAKEARFIKALAHPSRLEIVHLLRAHALTVNQMAQMLGTRQAYVSQQLVILKQAKVVTGHRVGKEVYYEITDPRIVEACDSLHSFVSDKPLGAAPEPVVIDPICHMHLTPTTASYVAEYNGVREYFCGKGCVKEFHAQH